MDDMTLGEVGHLLSEDRAALPSLYGPGHVEQEVYYDAANPVAEADQALSTLMEYLRGRVSERPDTPDDGGEKRALTWVRDCFNLDTEDIDALNEAIAKGVPE